MTGVQTCALPILEKKLLAMHFRSRVAPSDFMNSIYISKGWNDLGQDYKAYQSAMQQARSQNNRFGMYQITQAWKAVTDSYGQSNPIWFADYSNPTRVDYAKNAVQQFETMQKDGVLNTSPEGKKIASILGDYNAYHQVLTQYTVNGKHLPGYSTIQDAWYTYLSDLEANDSSLTGVIGSVFRRVS